MHWALLVSFCSFAGSDFDKIDLMRRLRANKWDA